jgi:SAM-dependent methyltransferase
MEYFEKCCYEDIIDRIETRGLVLDIGCGQMIARKYVDGTYVGLDVAGKPNVRGDAVALPFREGSFDSVISIVVIQHISADQMCFKEIKRVLRDSGFALIVLANKYTTYWLNQRIYKTIPYAYMKFYTIPDIVKLLKSEGLRANDYGYHEFLAPFEEYLPLAIMSKIVSKGRNWKKIPLGKRLFVLCSRQSSNT